MRGRAAVAGALAARRRQYDEWSFTTTIAYLEGLCRQRDQAIAENAADAWAEAQRIHEAILRQRRAERIAAELAKETVETARLDRDRARGRERITLEGLDIMAGAWAPREGPAGTMRTRPSSGTTMPSGTWTVFPPGKSRAPARTPVAAPNPVRSPKTTWPCSKGGPNP